MERRNTELSALVLAAGIGSRLRPATETTPKAMLPIAEGLPLLEHVVHGLRMQGIRDVVINLHHRPERIVGHFGNGARFGVRIAYSDESSRLLDTAGAIRKAAPLVSDDFLLIYSDHLHFYEYGPLIELHRRRGALLTLALKRSDLPQNGDLAELDPASSRIVRWWARPHEVRQFSEHRYLNTGIDVISRRLAGLIPLERPVSLDREILPWLMGQAEAVYGLPTDVEILDIGTPEKYEFAKAWYARQAASRPRNRKALFLDRDGVILCALPRGEYLTTIEQMQYMDGIRRLLAAAGERGYLNVVVTNQSHVSRGLLSLAELEAIHERMAEELDLALDAIFFCPHHASDACECRKPKPGLLLRAARDMGLDLSRSIMVGDSDRDVQAGVEAGCRTVFLRNEFNAGEREHCRPDHTLDTLAEVEALLG